MTSTKNPQNPPMTQDSTRMIGTPKNMTAATPSQRRHVPRIAETLAPKGR